MKTLHRKRKSGYNHERCQHDSPFKRRKFYDRGPAVTFDGGFSCESVTNSPDKSRNRDKSGSMSEGLSLFHNHISFYSTIFGIAKFWVLVHLLSDLNFFLFSG